MKFILILAALLALVYSSKALKCYECRFPDFRSSKAEFNTLPLCEKEFEKSKTVEVPQLQFPKCLKIIEKLTVSGREEAMTLRTSTNSEDIKLDSNIFEVHMCNTDLCNTATYSKSAWFVVFSAIILIISVYI